MEGSTAKTEVNANETATKRKAHRRKPGGKRKKEHALGEHWQPPSEQPEQASETSEPPRKHWRAASCEHQQRGHHRGHNEAMPHHILQQKNSHHRRRLLRPAKVPKAPQNSTQFIIDDHENSAHFIDFEKGFTSPGARDDVGWSPYFVQDFENVYRTTREAHVIDWNHEVLVDKISSLEERVKTLEQQLSLCDPNEGGSYAVSHPHLQHRIVCVQDPSQRLKEFRIWCPMHGKKVRLRHSVTEEESSGTSDCSSSSQEEEDDDDGEEEEEEGQGAGPKEAGQAHHHHHHHAHTGDNGHVDMVVQQQQVGAADEDNDDDSDDDDSDDDSSEAEAGAAAAVAADAAAAAPASEDQPRTNGIGNEQPSD